MIRTLFFVLVAFSLALPSCSDSSPGDSLMITGSSTVAPVVADAARRYEEQHPGTRIDVQSGGSSRGISDAGTGLAAIGMASRALKPGEDHLTAHTIAVDGVCLIVHRDNPVRDLRKAQVLDIYRKKVTNWKSFGGPDAEIVVASKAAGRATLEVFLDYLEIDSADVEADVIVGENQQAIKTVAGNPNAIAYVSIGAAASEAENGTPIHLVSSDGIPATTANVANGSFPVTRPLNLLIHGEPRGLQTDFLAYLLSPAIHDIVESHLYVPAVP